MCLVHVCLCVCLPRARSASLLVRPGAMALWQPHLLDLAASHRRDLHDVVMHVGAGGLAKATVKPGPCVQ